MIQVEEAEVYFLKPIDALEPDYDPTEDYTPEQLKMYPDLIYDNALVVGSKNILNEVAVFMDNDDVISTVGVFPKRCVIITDLPRERCKEIIKLGTENYDRKMRKAIKKDPPIVVN
jgi:hypothetical protein